MAYLDYDNLPWYQTYTLHATVEEFGSRKRWDELQPIVCSLWVILPTCCTKKRPLLTDFCFLHICETYMITQKEGEKPVKSVIFFSSWKLGKLLILTKHLWLQKKKKQSIFDQVLEIVDFNQVHACNILSLFRGKKGKR